MRISTAAGVIGVPAHVLRHWEDEGVLTPDRSGANQRDYTEQHVHEARIIHRLRQAGVGLPAIRQLRSAGGTARPVLLSAAADRLSAEADRTAAAAAFLRHTVECRHPILEECRECRAYATSGEPSRERLCAG
ncbi:helix-turn-helix domain-containing protein [Myceligenerans crystallogenes]|uniref:MerR family transcriptional regulator n=1 Tax=Myceligenerans crystallogenes TaxID=316335 RepID=A0ABN2N8R0_9MICO